jgi:hypothetical protein
MTLTSDISNRPLDHATARIVAELAAALLPPLTSDVKKAVTAEILKELAALSERQEQRAEELFAPFLRLREEIGRAGSEAAASFAAAEASVKRSESELSASINRFGERMESIAARLTQAADELGRQSSGQFTALSSALDSVKPGLDDETLEDVAGLLRFLKEAIPGWEGVLKADGRMQTRELSEFSAEMSELTKDMKLNLTTAVRESAEKDAARREEKQRLLEENWRTMELRLAKLEKIVILTGAVSAFFWVTLLLLSLLGP